LEQVSQMTAPPRGGLRRNRAFILGSLSFGHGISHLYDMGFPVFMPAISVSMGLSYLQVGGFGSIFYYGGTLTALAAVTIIFIPLRRRESAESAFQSPAARHT